MEPFKTVFCIKDLLWWIGIKVLHSRYSRLFGPQISGLKTVKKPQTELRLLSRYFSTVEYLRFVFKGYEYGFFILTGLHGEMCSKVLFVFHS
jgi:hypothetical protein